MHTNASGDSPADMEDMIRQAVSLGLDEICITDHVDFPPVEDIRHWPVISGAGVSSQLEWARILEDGETCEIVRIPFDEYVANYQRLAEAYKDRITVKLGCEIGISYHCRQAIHAHLAKYPFDFVIGSQHTVDRFDICGNRETFFIGKTKHEAYTAHLEEMADNVRSYDCFDVLGHMDYIIRYVPYQDRQMHVTEFADLLDGIFTTLVHKGKGLELNTSGLRYKLGQAHPHIDILRRYRALGGEIITVGSDAHRPNDLAAYMREAEEILREAGFKAYCKFNARVPIFIDL